VVRIPRREVFGESRDCIFCDAKHPRESVESRAKRINELKAHVDLQAAEEAVKTVDQKRIEVREIVPAIAAGW
jgi:hypothetical protein